MKRVIATALLGAVFLTAGAGALQAQDEWARQVRGLLDRASESFASRGYRMSHDIFQGRLDDDATDDLSVQLRAGQEYEIIGACDNDCQDLDLVLYDDNGNTVDSDLATDDFPIVSVTPRRNGRFRIHVSMANCTAEPCRFGVGIYARDAQGGGSSSSSSSGSSGEGDRWEAVVRSQLDQAGQAATSMGYSMSHDIYQGRLDDDAVDNLTVNLRSGQRYKILGVCDQDCRDIDLTLYDGNGNVVASDLATDDKPELTVTPSRGGEYRVKVSMANCTADPCRYGVGIWSRDAGTSDPETSSSSGGSSDGDQWEAVVRSQLQEKGREAEQKGFQMSHEIFMGRLDDDANESLNIPLDAGTHYVMWGVCDQDCTDIDLTIYDPDGNKVGEDVATDDHPHLDLVANATGRYRVKVGMVTCSADPCRYGVGVWAK
jgi:hypothetical protein